MDTIKYELYTKADKYSIVFNKIDQTFAIHTLDLDQERPMVVGFKTAGDAIIFAEDRINTDNKEKDQ